MGIIESCTYMIIVQIIFIEQDNKVTNIFRENAFSVHALLLRFYKFQDLSDSRCRCCCCCCFGLGVNLCDGGVGFGLMFAL